MAITISIDTPIKKGEGTSLVTDAFTPVSGDTLMVICVAVDDTTEGDITSITSSPSQTITQSGDFLNGNQRVRMYHIINPTQSSTTITVNFGSATDAFLDAFTLQGTATTSPIDVTATSNGNSTSPSTSITPNDTTKGCIVWLVEQISNSTYTALGTGQSERGMGAVGGAEKSSCLFTSEIYTAAPGTQSATASKSEAWIGLAVEVKESGVTEQSKTFTADTVLKATDQSKTFTIDASLKGEVSKTLTTDAVLKSTDNSKTLTTDSVLKTTDNQKTFTIDTVLKVTDQSKTFTIDTVLKTTDNSKTFTIDTVLKSTSYNTTFTIDTALRGEATADARLLEDGTSFRLLEDNLFFRLLEGGVTEQSKTFTMDAVLKTTDNQKTITTDTVLKATNQSKTLTTDAVLKTTNQSKTFTTDTVLKTTDTQKTFTTDVVLKVTDQSKTLTIDTVLKKEQSKTFTTDTVLKKEQPKTLTTDAVLKKEDNSKTFTIDTPLQKEQSKTFTVDTVLQKEVSNTFTIDASLARDDISKTFTIDANLSSGVVVVPTGGGAGTFGKIKRRLRRRTPFREETQFSQMIQIKPTIIKTMETSLKGIPLLRQYSVKITDIMMRPITKTSEIIASYLLKPTVKNNVRFGITSPAPQFAVIQKIMVARIKLIPIRTQYFSTRITIKDLHGIELIRKAMKMSATRSFEFRESSQQWEDMFDPKYMRTGINSTKLNKLWNELTISQRKKLLDKMKLDPTLSTLEFDQLPNAVQKTFTDTNKDDLLKVLGLIVGVSLLGLFLNILDAPPDKPISEIKDEPVEPFKPDKPDREPTFDMPSSFVGKVTYSPDFSTLEIELLGRVYGFCGVPERIFDSFEGASSKGAYFNRNIKGQFDCA